MSYEGEQAEGPGRSVLRRDRDSRDRMTFQERGERADKTWVALEQSFDRLAEKLTPVLGHDRPSAAMQGETSVDPESDVARFIESVESRAASLASRIDYLTERVDL